MLVASIEYAEAHDYLSERMKKAYAFLRDNDLSALACGRHNIDGEDVFANVMEYDTVPAEEKKLEAHKRYYDVQCVACGIERVEVAPVAGLTCAKEYDEADDYALFESPAPATSLVLHAGEIAVLPPEDAHKPGCNASDAPVHVKKVVVKVRA
ncbi:YhcH/YjgK/YiaL family protein [uncultured Ellagibacter sp.]|uniref:YhcH/YjgK/YiaL family protein n=1 Tax=uncultured Ellagibacter sp. TaxID=2137580 RepID=UPI00260F9FC3|nr:YhcH/YjgK/YiaL family protein [uncultured Ellagibacter sp.]